MEARRAPAPCSYLERMYARPRAPQRIADIFRIMRSGEVSGKTTARGNVQYERAVPGYGC